MGVCVCGVYWVYGVCAHSILSGGAEHAKMAWFPFIGGNQRRSQQGGRNFRNIAFGVLMEGI